MYPKIFTKLIVWFFYNPLSAEDSSAGGVLFQKKNNVYDDADAGDTNMTIFQ